jgi:ABC-type transporter Mla subunit MlaD
MRRILAVTALALCLSALLLVSVAGGQDENGGGGTYRVRAIFDNGSFIVKDENVRIGGANVGAVESVDVTMPGEEATANGGDFPGKAVVILRIDNPGFQDFREDASCRIRPQSLIGERFVECEPTQPRQPGTEPPPPLEQIPDGEAGEGQYLLPLENNGTAVDTDLINNIMRRPYADRFRLILNSLGAALGARGEELNEIVRRANPALRETDEVLRILAGQSRELAKLNADSDAILTALARERDSLSGFLRSSGEVSAATAERRTELAENISLLPATLVELRQTMDQLGAFSDAAQPVFEVLGNAAPALTRTTRQLTPFADATTVSLESLGDAAVEAGPDLRDADPVVRLLRDMGRAGQRPAGNLGRLTGSLRETGGFDDLLDYIFNTAGTVNGFDRYGHYQLINILISACIEYGTSLLPGCGAQFDQEVAAGRQDTLQDFLRIAGRNDEDSGGAQSLTPQDGPTTGIGRFVPAPIEELLPEEETPEPVPVPESGAPQPNIAGAEAIDFLLGP